MSPFSLSNRAITRPCSLKKNTEDIDWRKFYAFTRFFQNFSKKHRVCLYSMPGAGAGGMWKRDFHVRLDADSYVTAVIIADSSKHTDDLDLIHSSDDLYRQWLHYRLS